MRGLIAAEASNVSLTDTVSTAEVISAIVSTVGAGVCFVAADHLAVVAAEHLRVVPGASTCMLDSAPGVARNDQPKVAAVLMTAHDLLNAGPGISLASQSNANFILLVIDDGTIGPLCLGPDLSGRVATHSAGPSFSVSLFARSYRKPMRRVSSRAELADAIRWASTPAAAAVGPVILHVSVSNPVPTFHTTGLSEMPRPSSKLLVRPARKGDERCLELAAASLRGYATTGEHDIWDPLAMAFGAHPKKLAVVDDELKLTYAQLHGRVTALAGFLLGKNIKVGERVGVMLPNCASVLEAHYAIAGGCRGIVLNLNQRLAPVELQYIFSNARPVWLIVSTEYKKLAEQALELCRPDPTVLGIIWVNADSSFTASLPDGVEQATYEEALATDSTVKIPVASVDGKTVSASGAEMYYTSGTTGRPKGVVLTHKIVILHALGCMVEHRIQTSDRWLHVAPMFHLVDAYAMFSITWVGGLHVMHGVFSAASAAEAIEVNKITVSNMASTMITLITLDPDVETRDFTSLALLSCGGAPLNRTNMERALRIFECEYFLSYGMTECCGKISMSLLTDAVRELGQATMMDFVASSGRPFMLPNEADPFFSFSVRVIKEQAGQFIDVDKTGADVGEVFIRGDTVFDMYWQNQEATDKSFQELDGHRWFKTGDLAFLDKMDYLYITDRAKDMILVGSENVYSVEVERALQDHVDVVHACVYGVPDPAMGEAVKVVVQMKKSVSPGAAMEVRRMLQKHCRPRLADFKRPSQYQFIDKMPLTGSGKLAKAEVRKLDSTLKRAGARPAAETAGCAAPSDNSIVLDEDTYEIRWSKQPSLREKGALSGEHWVILADKQGVGASLKAEMEAAGATVSLGAAPSEIRRLVSEKTKGVVLLVSLDSCDYTLNCQKTIDQTHQILADALQCVQGLADAAPKLCFATRGAAATVAVKGRDDLTAQIASSVCPGMQALWGFVRVVTAERPALQCRVVDLCPCESDPAEDARTVLQELASPFSADTAESAWRARERYLPSLALIDKLGPSSELASLQAEACYIITGGTGGLGPHLAERLLECGAKNIVLTGRRDPSENFKQMLRQKEASSGVAGASICIEQADVGTKDGVSQLYERIQKNYPPCRGIFHLAGLEGDGHINDVQSGAPMAWADFAKVLVPKVQGSMYLHHFAGALGLPLDHFVLFSSVYGLLGREQLSHYAAANAFQDGLSHARQGHGLPGVAVSWGTWAGAGMASRYGRGFEKEWNRQGMHFIELKPGMATLAAVMESGVPHAAVLPADWSMYGAFIQKRQNSSQPLPRALVDKAGAGRGQAAGGTLSSNLTAAAREILQHAARPKQAAAMQEKVIEIIREIIEGVVDDWDIDAVRLQAPCNALSDSGGANTFSVVLNHPGFYRTERHGLRPLVEHRD